MCIVLFKVRPGHIDFSLILNMHCRGRLSCKLPLCIQYVCWGVEGCLALSAQQLLSCLPPKVTSLLLAGKA